MISVVIPTRDSATGLAATLGCLVGAAVDGLVKEVLVADGGSTDETLEIADDAGARILSSAGSEGARMAEACAAARGGWLLVLAPGTRLGLGWERAVAEHLMAADDLAGFFSLRLEGAFLGRLGRSALARVGLPSLPQGLLISRRLYDSLGGYGDIARPDLDLARRIGRNRLRRLAASALA